MSKNRSMLLFGAVSLILCGITHDNAWGNMAENVQNTTEPQNMPCQSNSLELAQLAGTLRTLMGELSSIKEISLKQTVASFQAEARYVTSLLAALEKVQKGIDSVVYDALAQPLKHLSDSAHERHTILTDLKPTIQTSLSTIKAAKETFDSIKNTLERGLETASCDELRRLQNTAEAWKNLKQSALNTIQVSNKSLERKLSDTVKSIVTRDITARWNAIELQMKASLKTIKYDCDDLDKQTNERFKHIVDSWRAANIERHNTSMYMLKVAKRDFLSDLHTLRPDTIGPVLMSYFLGHETSQKQITAHTQESRSILVLDICSHLITEKLTNSALDERESLARLMLDDELASLAARMLRPDEGFQVMNDEARKRNPLLLTLFDAITDLLESDEKTPRISDIPELDSK